MPPSLLTSTKAQFWRTIPLSSRVTMMCGVFCLFATMGFVQLLMTPVRDTVLSAAITVCLYGIFAVGYALLSITRRYRWVAPWAALHVFAFWAFANFVNSAAYIRYAGGRPEAVKDVSLIEKQMLVLGSGAIIMVTIGYVLFIVFIRREGNRFFRVQTEMELAREIHRSLVPPFERRIAAFDVFGTSVASGEVGGDLVDLAESPAGWMGYIADISGHGVSSGVLMAMFKTSIRSRLAEGGTPGELLEQVHRALFPLKMPNMFVTAGVLQLSAENRVNYALAGHPPLLHFSRRQNRILEYVPQNMPIGILLEQQFLSSTLECEPEDVLLLLTDGLSEVFNSKGNELGLDPIKQEFQRVANRPLGEIFNTLRSVALDFGHQDDDQTVLLARYAG